MTDRTAFRFYIGWAPDRRVALCAEICRCRNVRATFLPTQADQLLNDLAFNPVFDVGIQPKVLIDLDLTLALVARQTGNTSTTVEAGNQLAHSG